LTAIARIDEPLAEIVLEIETIVLGSPLFPRRRTQVADHHLALAVVELRHLPELQGITLA
jgi:hypothetical protein